MVVNASDLVLELLYDRVEGCFSLDELAGEAGLTGPRLKRVLEEIRSRGLELELSPASGVRLVRPVRLQAHLIERDLGTKRVGRSVICFSEVGSTNDVAMDSARQGGTDGLVVLAESQRSGRGRGGRRWLSPPEANILLSAVLIEEDPDGLSQESLTIAAGLAVAEGIEGACGLTCQLKWPNDVMLEDAKVAGVLVEVRRQVAPGKAGRRCVVIGIGINVNARPPDREVGCAATDLAEHVGCAVERTEVIRAVLRRLDRWVQRISLGRLESLHDKWLSRCGMVDQRITILCAGRRYVGRVLDVSPLEGLILCCDDGRRVHLPAVSSTVVD